MECRHKIISAQACLYNFDLKNYLAENKLLKENTLAGYYGNDASKELRTLANEIDTMISDHPEKENLNKDQQLISDFSVRLQNLTILSENLIGSMTSVFPATTASAITTFATGLAPQQHAFTGWFMFLKEIGCANFFDLNF